TGDSTPQVKALMNYTKDRIKELFSRLPLRYENDAKNRWNLLDYGDVVVHILHRDERETYAIEKFWNNAFSISQDEWLKLSEKYSMLK
ncbi:RsfS/YbeB/iojap family protein, partial [bacterium]|nr:RsfS/YbeB/iojap family protein [bacterium]